MEATTAISATSRKLAHYLEAMKEITSTNAAEDEITIERGSLHTLFETAAKTAWELHGKVVDMEERLAEVAAEKGGAE